jgi:hypothetical protein
MGRIGPDDTSMYVDQETRIQILDSIEQLPSAEKDQCAAFIRNERALVLWAYSLEQIIPLYEDFEEKLIKHIWRTRPMSSANQSVTSLNGIQPSAAPSAPSTSTNELNEKAASGSPEDQEPQISEKTKEILESRNQKSTWWSWRLQPHNVDPSDTEKGPNGQEGERKIMLMGPFYAGCGAGLSLYFCLSGVGTLLREYALDKNPMRFVLVATLPIIFCISVFFCLQLVGNLSLVLGPVAQYHENSMYYSAKKPAPNPEVDDNLPHITIQMPVYKESLELTMYVWFQTHLN